MVKYTLLGRNHSARNDSGRKHSGRTSNWCETTRCEQVIGAKPPGFHKDYIHVQQYSKELKLLTDEIKVVSSERT
jgi:hypothetical protein